jgi:hypothetical protein
VKDTQRIRSEDWEADWEGHRRWQLTAGLAATPAQRLAWLEEMIELAHRCGAIPRAKADAEE